MTTTTAKRCSTCKALKPITDFHRDRHKPDGHRYDCKRCVRVAQADAKGGYRNGSLRFLREYGPYVDTLGAVDAALGRAKPSTIAPADLTVGRVVAVTDTHLAALIDGDPTARAEALRKIGGTR